MSSDVVLSSALRSNLLSLQKTQSNIDKVQNALSSGLKVSSALDNPQSYFAARSLNNRAGDLAKLLDGIGQSISTIKQADTTVQSLTKLYEQADSIISSAAGAAADASVAKLTGDRNLKGINALSTVGIVTGDQILIDVKSADGLTTHPRITATLDASDSIEELLTKINNSAQSVVNGDRIVEASLNADGFLQIKSLTGGQIRMAVESNTASNDTLDAVVSSAIGFSRVLSSTNPDGTVAVSNQLSATAVSGNKIVSGKFHVAGGGYASNSTALNSILDAPAGAARFGAAAASEDFIDITVNGTTVAIPQINGVTRVADIVDGINNNTQLNGLIKASYDDTTGEFSIEKISSTVRTVEIGTHNEAGTAAQTANFGFGFQNLASTAAANEESEAFVFSDASGELAQYTKDFDKVLSQIDSMIKDSGYKGANLLAGENLVTYFNADRSNALTSTGQDLTSGGLGVSKADFSTEATINSARSEIRLALGSIRNYAGSLANDLSIIQGREEFTKATINNLAEGADKLTVADQNEEGARLLALQTRQQLGVTALSLAAQAQQSVLRLF